MNYLTDDPWNPRHRSAWFLAALPHYDWVFSPRRSNLDDLRRAGCRHVVYVPFAYNPALHFSEPPTTVDEQRQYACDVLFAGGADQDRIPWISALVRAGFHVALYGGYWERYRETRGHTHGHTGMATLRKAIGGARVALCLVRRANRDGHVMRTFETPAIGACMLTEDTPEHREIFGDEGESVIYFQTVDQMVEKLRWLLDHDDERRRLEAAARASIVGGHNTYQDRLTTMLELAGYNIPTFEPTKVLTP
jgi:spore maturation protein CgeB